MSTIFKKLLSPALFCLIVGPLAAQTQTSPQAPKPAPSDQAEIVREARAAIEAAPPSIVPGDLLTFGTAEVLDAKLHDDAVQDMATAFEAARALRPVAVDGRPDGRSSSTKASVELGVVTNLIRAKEFERALALARTADTPRAPLYDALIGAGGDEALQMCSGMRGYANLGRVVTSYPTFDELLDCTFNSPLPAPGDTNKATARPAVEPDPLTLARECYAADGTFPYKGVWLAYENRREQRSTSGGGTDTDLMREIYARAGDDSVPGKEAVAVLNYGHATAKSLDGQLEDTTVSALRHLQQYLETNPSAADAANANDSGHRLLNLLVELDAARAAEMTSQMPSFAAAADPFDALRAEPPPPPDPALLIQDATASAPQNDQQAVQKIRDLAQAARQLLASSPAQARAAALAADHLLSDSVLASDLPEAMLLANIEKRVGLTAEANAVVLRCFERVEKVDVAFDREWADMSPAQQAASFGPSPGENLNMDTSLVYDLGSSINFALAVQRAEASRAVIYKPLMLIAVLRASLAAQPGSVR